MKGFIIRKAVSVDAPKVDGLLSEWFDWHPKLGRLAAVQRAIGKKEVLVAESHSQTIGFIHYVIHEDVIDGGPNAFISAFYVKPEFRNKGVGSCLLVEAISDSLSRGAVGVETSTIHSRAKRLYERHHFKQTLGDMGEVFLELDIDEHIKAGSETGPKSLQP